MKFIKTLLLIFGIILYPIFFVSAETRPENKIDIDSDNGYVYRVLIDKDSVGVFKGVKDNAFSLLHTFTYTAVKLCRFDQYDLIENRFEKISGHDIGTVFNSTSDFSRIRYSSMQSTFSKDKFIFADINNDGLPDFVKIEEPSVENGWYYRHLIYYQNKDGSFLETPDIVVKEKSSSWISGIYYDVNNGGIPDKIGISYKHFGTLLSNTKCTINVYFFDNKTNMYKNEPDMHLVSIGTFYERNNFTDINNDGYPDIFIVDVSQKPHSIEDAISKIFDRNIAIDIKFYLYNKEAGGYPPAPSFVKRINVDALKDFIISFSPSSNSSDYKDLIITQSNHSERHIFNLNKHNFD